MRGIHEQEAFIIAQAGAPGAVTIATNMAGRGTDIQLGGNVDMPRHGKTADIEDKVEIAAVTGKVRAEVAENGKIAGCRSFCHRHGTT